MEIIFFYANVEMRIEVKYFYNEIIIKVRQ